MSVSFAEDRYQLHLNAGVDHHQPDDNTTLIWGIGGVANLDFPVMLFAEVFGRDDLPGLFYKYKMVSIEQYKKNIKMAQMRYRMGGDKEVARGAKRDLRKQELMKRHLFLADPLLALRWW